MQIDPDALPDDAAALQRILRAVLLQQSDLHAENDKLRLLIQRLLRHQFGRRSEQLSLDQLRLGLEDLEQTIAANQAAQEALAHGAWRPRAEPPARNHGALPAHLPRFAVVIDIENRDCPCCGVALTPIGELRTEQLDLLPAQLHVRVTRRPQLRLPRLRGCRGDCARAGPAGRWRDAHRGADRACGGEQVRRRATALSPDADPLAAGRHAGSLDAGQLGRTRVLVAAAAP